MHSGVMSEGQGPQGSELAWEFRQWKFTSHGWRADKAQAITFVQLDCSLP